MLRKIFLAALATRWAYALLMFALMGDAGLESIDSETYLFYGREFAAELLSGSLSGFQWLGPTSYLMPITNWLFGVCGLLFGASTALGYVLLQGLIDAATCLLVYALARTLDDTYAAPAGFAAALNPTQIVLSGMVLTDTPFLFFCAAFLVAAAYWLRAATWRWAALIGFALGAATLTRALAAPFAAVLLLFLLIAGLVGKMPVRRIALQLVGAAVICSLCIAPVVWRNVKEFGAWSLTSQAGIHFALWIVPWIEHSADGISWTAANEDMQRRLEQRFPTPTADPFEQSRRYQAVGREELARLPVRAIAQAWLIGAAINLGSPAVIISPPVMKLPHTGFYGTPGASPLDKIGNFLFHSDNATYAWILLVGIAAVIVVRLIQLIGFGMLLRQGGQLPVLCLCGLWIAYVLAVNGPVASPKYRLPIEPPLMVCCGAGLSMLLRRRRDPLDH